LAIITYIIDEDRRLQLTPSEEAARLLDNDVPLWVDIEGAGIETRSEWMTKLSLHGLTRRLCLDASDHPGFYPLQSEIVLVLPVLNGASGAPALQHLCVVCRDRLLLTLHDHALASAERLSDIEDADAWLSARSGPALLAAVLIDVSTDNLRWVQSLRRAITALEAQMDKAPGDVDPDAIMDLRAQLLTVVAAVSDALPIVVALDAVDAKAVGTGAAYDFLKCAVVNLRAADGQLEWLDNRISDLRSRFELHAQEQTNQRLNILTVLSAIFMPVTLMASIWGMNFATMPELALPYAYPVAIVAMVAVASGMYLFFKRTGWFD